MPLPPCASPLVSRATQDSPGLFWKDLSLRKLHCGSGRQQVEAGRVCHWRASSGRHLAEGGPGMAAPPFCHAEPLRARCSASWSFHFIIHKKSMTVPAGGLFEDGPSSRQVSGQWPGMCCVPHPVTASKPSPVASDSPISLSSVVSIHLAVHSSVI